MTSEADLGRLAVQTLCDRWDDPGDYVELRTEAFAAAAIDAFRASRESRRGTIWDRQQAGAERSATQLNSDPHHGILEVLQNAQDAGATYLRIALRKRDGKSELLFVHDGRPLALAETMSMSLAYLSTKEGDARAIGKFGIGLKTLHQLGSALKVHGHPYHFQIIKGGLVDNIASENTVAGVYDDCASQTLLVLPLGPDVDVEELLSWLAGLDPSLLIFLPSVRELTFTQLARSGLKSEAALIESASDSFTVDVGRRATECTRTNLQSPAGSEWTRYEASVIVPDILRSARSGKSVGATTRLGIAVARSGGSSSAVYTGLPTLQTLDFPFALNAAFELDTAREKLMRGSKWNAWLLDEIRKFSQAIAVYELGNDAASAWALVALVSEASALAEQDEWLANKMTGFVSQQQAHVVRYGRLGSDGEAPKLRDVVYGSEDIGSVLAPGELEWLAVGSVAIRDAQKDATGRWRDVLDDLGVSRRVDASDLEAVFDWPDEVLDRKPAKWFVSVAARMIDAGESKRLFNRDSVVLATGARVKPSRNGAGLVLVKDHPPDTLAARLGVVGQLDKSYFTASADPTTVRTHLQGEGALAHSGSSEVILQALAGLAEPIQLREDELDDLRTLLYDPQLDAGRAIQLGLSVGSRALIDGKEFVDGKPQACLVKPAEAYLPAALDEKNAWAVAAGSIDGLKWVSARYKQMRTDDARDLRGGQAFLRMLGANNYPRLVEPSARASAYSSGGVDYSIHWMLLALQDAALRRLGWPSGSSWRLQADWESPDLLSVARDIAAMSVGPARVRRATALLNTLRTAWARHLEERASAVAVSGRSRRPMGRVPSTWIAELADIEWLSTSGAEASAVAPREALVQTPGNRAVFGSGARWCAEIDPEAADHPLLLALGVGVQPRASALLEALSLLRASDNDVAWGDVALRYAGLAAYCNDLSHGAIDDVPVDDLRRRFGQEKLAWCDGQWRAPGRVFRGRPIFGDATRFVWDDPSLAPLWDVLGIEEPNAPECIEWLQSAAKRGKPDGPEVLGLLTATYRHLAGQLDKTSPTVRKSLRRLPLWTPAGWSTKRPLYVEPSAVLRDRLGASGAPVWLCPCPPHTLGKLPEVMGLSSIGATEWELGGSSGGGEAEEVSTLLSIASTHLRSMLIQDKPSIEALIPGAAWDELRGLSASRVDALSLRATVGARAWSVPIDVWVTSPPDRAVLFTAESSIGTSAAGGEAIARMLVDDPGARADIARAWVGAWQCTLEGHAAIEVQMPASVPSYAKEPMQLNPDLVVTQRSRGARSKAAEQEQKPLRRLLKHEEDLASGTEIAPAGPRREGRMVTAVQMGEVAQVSPAKGRGRGTAAPQAGVRGYSDADREVLGMRLLAKHLSGQGVTLEDRRAEKGLGADGLGSDGKLYELKVHAADAPAEVRMPLSEVRQALTQKDNYILVIVEGVEAGHETRLTFIPDPIGQLDLIPAGEMRVSGFGKGGFRVLVMPDETEGPSDA